MPMLLTAIPTFPLLCEPPGEWPSMFLQKWQSALGRFLGLANRLSDLGCLIYAVTDQYQMEQYLTVTA